MEPQNYKNHVRFYPPHHFVFYPMLLVLLAVAIYFSYRHQETRMIWVFIAIVLLMMGWLSFMMRQHYALNNQNRIVRLEMRYRYFALTGKRLEPLEDRLSFGQLSALRFAGDQELPALLDRSLAEQLSPDSIKKAIVHWQADYMRV